MSYINKLNLTFSAVNENESFARLAIASFCACKIKSIEELSDIKTVVSEAVTNSIVHGYEGVDGEISINCEVDDEKVFIEVIDKGIGIENVEKAKMPFYTSKPELERSGMGFTVMEGFMDKMEIESAVGMGTTIKLYKYYDKNCIEKNEKVEA